MLKEIVDETSIGKYDFMYLRIGKWLTLFGMKLVNEFALNRLCEQLQVRLRRTGHLGYTERN